MATRDQLLKQVISRIFTLGGPDEYYLAPATTGMGATQEVVLKGTFLQGDLLSILPRSTTTSGISGMTLETGSPDFLIIREDRPPRPPDPVLPNPPAQNVTFRTLVPWNSISLIQATQVYRAPLLAAKSKAGKGARKKQKSTV